MVWTYNTLYHKNKKKAIYFLKILKVFYMSISTNIMSDSKSILKILEKFFNNWHNILCIA